jgi:hypothetical protein
VNLFQVSFYLVIRAAMQTGFLNNNLYQASKFVARQIGRLKVRCANVSKGCNYQGPVSENHSTTVSESRSKKTEKKKACFRFVGDVLM